MKKRKKKKLLSNHKRNAQSAIQPLAITSVLALNTRTHLNVLYLIYCKNLWRFYLGQFWNSNFFLQVMYSKQAANYLLQPFMKFSWQYVGSNNITYTTGQKTEKNRKDKPKTFPVMKNKLNTKTIYVFNFEATFYSSPLFHIDEIVGQPWDSLCCCCFLREEVRTEVSLGHQHWQPRWMKRITCFEDRRRSSPYNGGQTWQQDERYSDGEKDEL